MKLLSVTLFALCLIFGIQAEDECPQNDKVIFCYWSSWSVYRAEGGYFNVSHIDPHMCTHIVYAFAGLSIYGGLESLDPSLDYGIGGYSGLVALKEENPCLKTMLAIGGWNQGSRPYSVMVSDAGYRKAFVESVIRLLAVYDFDGLDVDWEYPTQRGGIPEDKENFGYLLKELKQMLGKWDLLLTIAVPTSVAIAEQAYDMATIDEYVDYVLIMGYDVTPTNSEVTGFSSPMSEIRKTVQFWTENISKEKVVLGVPAYGRTFNLLDPAQTGIGAPTNGSGLPGYYTKENGFLSYYETCNLKTPSRTSLTVNNSQRRQNEFLFLMPNPSAIIKSRSVEIFQKLPNLTELYKVITNLLWSGYTIVPNPVEENYYAYRDDQWMTFELADNYEAKANYVLEQGIGGMMVWSIDTDDFTPHSNDTAFPIVKVIRSVLLGETKTP